MKELWSEKIKTVLDKGHNNIKECEELENNIQNLIIKIMKATNESVIKVYEAQIAKYENERNVMKQNIPNYEISNFDFGTALQKVMNFVKDPADV